MKKYLLTVFIWLLCLPSVTAKLVYENVEIDGFTYNMYNEVQFYDGDVIHLVGDLGAMSDDRYAEFCETLHLCVPSTIEYEGEEYLVSISEEFFKLRDFKDMEILTFGGYSLQPLYDFPKLKRIIMEGNVIGFNCGIRNLPSLEQELELSVAPGNWDEKRGTMMYSPIRSSFINAGFESIRFSEGSILSRVWDSFLELPNCEEVTLCYIENMRDSFNHLPLLREVTFEIAPDRCYSSFYGLPLLKKVTLKRWNKNGWAYFSNTFTKTPLLKDIYIEEPVPCRAYFDFNANDVPDFWLEDGFFYPPHVTLHVPVGSRELYAAADGWKDFGEIVEYDPAGVDTPEADMPAQTWSCTPTGGGLTVSSDSDVALVVLTPAGATVRRLELTVGETASVELPAGVYIVAANGQSEKVCVR